MSSEEKPPKVRITKADIIDAWKHGMRNMPSEHDEQETYEKQIEDGLEHTEPDPPPEKEESVNEDEFPF